MKKRKLVWIFLIIFHCYNGICYGNDLVKIAISHLGNGEEGGNNKGKWVKLYNRGLEAPWCAGFVSYVMKEVDIDGLGYSLSAKDLYNRGRSLGYGKEKPRTGDLICFYRDNPKSWKGHIGIVEKVDEEYIYTIEANKGNYPAKVARYKYKKDNVPKLLGYIRVK